MARPDARDLAQRLRQDTAAEHRATEDVVGLPGSVTDRPAYARLLRRILDVHAAAEALWSAPELARAWAAVGIDVGQHRRSDALVADLADLAADGAPGARGDVGADERLLPADAASLVGCGGTAAFPRRLGTLYVLEGSSLGGRILAPAVRARLGDVPTTFLEGAGRHPRAWRAVQAALRSFHGDADAVVAGARAPFAVFARHVGAARTAGAVSGGAPAPEVAPSAAVVL